MLLARDNALAPAWVLCLALVLGCGSSGDPADTGSQAGGGGESGAQATGGTAGVAGGSDPGSMGLLAYWKFDEGSGTTVTDSSGNGNALSRTGPSGPEWVDGKTGSAARGLAGDSRLTAGDTLNDLGLPLSISAWLRFDSTVSPNGGQIVIATESGANRRGLSLEVAPAGDNYWFRHFDGDGVMRQLLAGRAPATMGWTHLAVVADSESIRLFVDGQVQSDSPTGTATAIASADGSVILARSVADAVGWSIDEVRVYDRALADDDVRFLAAQ